MAEHVQPLVVFDFDRYAKKRWPLQYERPVMDEAVVSQRLKRAQESKNFIFPVPLRRADLPPLFYRSSLCTEADTDDYVCEKLLPEEKLREVRSGIVFILLRTHQ
jgi:hypothetical protein